MTNGSSQRGGWRRHLAAWTVLGVGWAAVAAAGRAEAADPPAALGGDPARRAVAPIAPSLPGEIVAALQGGRSAEAIAALDPLIADASDGPGRPGVLSPDPRGGRPARQPARRGPDHLARRDRGRPDGGLGQQDPGRTRGARTGDRPPRPRRGPGPIRGGNRSSTPPGRIAWPRSTATSPAACSNPSSPAPRATRPPPTPCSPEARDLAKGPALRAATPVRDGPGRSGRFDDLRPERRTTRSGGRPATQLPGSQPDPIRDYNRLPQGISPGPGSRPGPVPPRRGPPATGPARRGPPDLDRPRPRPGQRPGVEQRHGRARRSAGRPSTGSPDPWDSQPAGQAALNLGSRPSGGSSARPPPTPGPARRLRDRPGLPQPGAGRPGDRGVHRVPQGGGLPRRGRRGPPDPRRAGDAGDLPDRPGDARPGQVPEAIAAFESYLTQYPNGPESGDARRAILDAQFARRRTHRSASSSPRPGPLGSSSPRRTPSTVGCPPRCSRRADLGRQKKWDEAVAAWDTLAARFPADAEAAHGQFEAAALVETEKGDPAAAIERFRKVTRHAPWADQAKQRIAVMEAKALTVVTPRTFRSGETAQLKVTTRNLDSLTFSAYKLNPEAYFRKKHIARRRRRARHRPRRPRCRVDRPGPGLCQYKPSRPTLTSR